MKVAWGYMLYETEIQHRPIPCRFVFELSHVLSFDKTEGETVQTNWIESCQNIFGGMRLVCAELDESCIFAPKLSSDVKLTPLALPIYVPEGRSVQYYLSFLGYSVKPAHEKPKYLVKGLPK